jgi:hypothetical protein
MRAESLFSASVGSLRTAGGSTRKTLSSPTFSMSQPRPIGKEPPMP